MSQPNWEKVDVPRGAYIGWGLRAGQTVTGKVVEYAPTGGRDFDQNACPALAVQLIEEAWSADKAQNWTKHAAGDLVQLNCGQVSLKRAVYAADPKPGDLVQIELENILFGQGKNGGDIKEFGIKIARGAGGPVPPAPPASAPAPAFAGPPQAGPPAAAAPSPSFAPPAPASDPWGAAPPPSAPAAAPFGMGSDAPPF